MSSRNSMEGEWRGLWSELVSSLLSSASDVSSGSQIALLQHCSDDSSSTDSELELLQHPLELLPLLLLLVLKGDPPRNLVRSFCPFGVGHSLRGFPPPPGLPFLLVELEVGVTLGFAKLFLGALATTAGKYIKTRFHHEQAALVEAHLS